MYGEGAGGERMPPEYYSPAGEGVGSKIKYNLEGLIPIILIIIIVAFMGHTLGFWQIPFLGGEQPKEMLIIGQPSSDLVYVLNNNKDMVRYTIRTADKLAINPREQLAQYDIVMLDQHMQTNKEVSRQLGEAVQDYVRTGGKFILVMDSGIRREGAADILGWEATFGDVIPVACDRAGPMNTPTCLQRTNVYGRIYRDKYNHPIMKGTEVAPPEESPLYFLETFPVNPIGVQVAYIQDESTFGTYYPAIVEKKLVVGKSIYFGYDPGKTRGLFEETLKYLT